MRNASAVLGLVVRRAMGNWRLLATVFAGVMLASALLASVAIYSDAIRDLGLRHALGEEPDQSLDIRILSSSQSMDPRLAAEREGVVEGLLQAQTSGYVSSVHRYGRSDTFFLSDVGGTYDEDDEARPRAHFQFRDDIEERVEVVAGEAPGEPGTTDEGYPLIPVWLGAPAAESLGVAVGDVYDLHPFWVQELRPVRVEVVGLIAPQDADEREWYTTEGRFEFTTTSWPTYPFWTTREVLEGDLHAYLGSLGGNLEHYAIVDRGAIDSGNAARVEGQVRGLNSALQQRLERTRVDTTLATAIDAYQERLFFTRLPLFALMLQIAGIVLYYLVMVSSMLVDRQTGEIALLRSRGASTGQVMGIYAIEGGLLAGTALIAGPLLAAGAIMLLGYTPPFSGLSGNSLLEVTLSPWAFGLAGLGAALSMAALLIPAYLSTRKSMLHYRQNLSRPPSQPAFLRYYLDLVVVGIAAYAFYQLQSRGSLVTDRLFGGLSADPLLLLAPTLFMLMVALVFLRMFPLVLRVASWAGRGLPGATIPLGLWHMVRSPAHYSRLILLLLLATAVGMFAAGFRATLEQSYDDRAAYEAGSAARIDGMLNRPGLAPEQFGEHVREVTGAGSLTPVSRLSGTYQPAQYQFEPFDVLAVDPDTFPEAAAWRDDFAADSLEELTNSLRTEPAAPTAATLEAGEQYAGMWARFDLGGQSGQPGVRLIDAEGTYWEYRLRPTSEPDADGWAFYTIDRQNPLSSRDGRTPALDAPMLVDSVYVRMAGASQSPVPVSMETGPIEASEEAPGEDGFAEPRVAEPFERVDGYTEISGASRTADPGTLSRSVLEGPVQGNGARVDASFEPGGSAVYGFRDAGRRTVIPVAASETFLSEHDLGTGDAFTVYLNRQYVSVEIVGEFAYFPTWDPEDRPLLVADLETLREVASRVPGMGDAVNANEVWIDDPGEARFEREYLSDQGLPIGDTYIEADLRAEAGADPLIAASWEGILFLSFAAVLLLTGLGFVVYSYLTAQTRALEFAILRTMGFSGKQILGLVSFEQIFVIASGVVVGTLLGNPLGRLMIGYMGITETGEEVLPPLVSSVSWGAVATVYSLLAIVLIATVVALVTLYSRLAVHRALRMGEL